MSFKFNPDEIFEMAEQIERNGADFYRKAASGSRDSGEKSFLEGLATMEEDHEKLFHEMRSGLEEADRSSYTFDPDGQAQLYLQAFADRHVFDTRVKPAEVLTGRETTEDILRTAIGLEKDSIVFYLGIKDAMANPKGKERVQAIVQEEMKHVSTLSKKLREAIKK
jgi:rubrerythrin